MPCRIEPLRSSFIAAEVMGSIGATTILTRRELFRPSLDGFRFIRWVSVVCRPNSWRVFEKESLDDRRAGNIDLTACFNDLDPDSPEGICHECTTPEQALMKCIDLGCTANSFVHANQIQDIYDTYTMTNGVPARSAAEYFTQGGP